LLLYLSEQVIEEEPDDVVKAEPADVDSMYLSDSNSMTDNREQFLENFGETAAENQQQIMELLNSTGNDLAGHYY